MTDRVVPSVIFCQKLPKNCLETEKGQNRSPVLTLTQVNIKFISNIICNRLWQQCRIYFLFIMQPPLWWLFFYLAAEKIIIIFETLN